VPAVDAFAVISDVATAHPLLIGFLTGGLVTAALTAFVKYWIFHPLINVRLDDRKGSYGEVRIDLTDDKGAKSICQAKYLRLHIENTGLSSIKDCCGYITKLTKIVGGQQTGSEQEVLDPGWSHHAQNTSRDIPRGAFFHMDVVTLLLPPNGGSALFWQKLPNTLIDFFSASKATYVLDVLMAADNARPCTIPVKFTFDPNHRDLVDIKWRTWARYPWWSRWRWTKWLWNFLFRR
jgi:hypothetical protein